MITTPLPEDPEPEHNEAETSRVLRVVDAIWEAAGVAAMVTAMLLIFGNASARYLLAKSIPWADEVVIGLIPWIAMIGLYLSIRRGSVIRIEYFFQKLPESLRPAFVLFTTLLSAAAFVQLAFYSFQYVSFFGKDLTPYLGIMRGWFTSAMVFGAGATALLFAAQALAPLLRRRGSK
jgi:TRAP-type C4-dicarboxylate transport system permease small subunit